MAPFSSASLFLVVFCSLILSIIKHLRPRLPNPRKTANCPLPPSISILPLLFHLITHRGSLQAITLLLRRYHSLHGPILSLRLSPFAQPTIFISSSSLSHTALFLHADSFANRPPPVEPNIFLTAGSHDISSSNHGSLWSLLRRNLSSQILHFASARNWAVQLLLQNIHSHAGRHDFIPKQSFRHAILCILAFMCFGEKLGERDICEILQLQSFILGLFSTFNIFAFFPAVTKRLFYKRWEDIVYARRRQAEIFLPLIRARREKKQNVECCYVDSLVDLRIGGEGDRKLKDDEIVNLCHEFLSGSATISTALEWTMAEIVKDQMVQSKLLAEIESFVGRDEEGIIKEEDLERMNYLKSVIIESLRRHPPSHFVLPHSVKKEVELNGYLIPVGAEVHFSVADVNWDRWNWEEPMEFRPERFMEGGQGYGVDITGRKGIKMMPFGAGWRLCPGHSFAILHLEFLVANLVREFEWKAEAGREVDLSEELDFTTVMKNSLTVHIVRRRREERRDYLVMTRRVKSFDPKGNLKLFHDVVCELKQDGLIVSRHEALLQLTHFHYILQLPYLELNRSLLLELITRYDKYDNSFSIAEHRLEFKSDHIAVIFGLPNHGKPVRLKSNMNNDFYHRIFKKETVSRYEIIYHLRRCAMDKSDDAIEAFVILLIGLFISMVLLPTRSTTIDSSLWNFLEQIDHINDCAWAPLVYRQLIDEINRAKREMTEEDSFDELIDDTYGGCFLALQLWICEIAGLGKAEKQDCSPRILGWGGNSMDGIFEQFRLLQPSDIRCALSPLESERHLLDSTILFACNKQACLGYSADFHVKVDSATQEWHMQHSSFDNVDRQELELLRHISAEQDKRIRHIEQELHRLKALGAAPLLSDGLDKVEVKTFDDNCKSKQHLQLHDSEVYSANNLDVREEQRVVSPASIGNDSTEKIVKKTVQKRSFNRLASPSIKTKHTEMGHSHSWLSSRGKIDLGRSLKIPTVKSDHTAVPTSEREVKMRVERQTWNRLFSHSIQANQKESVNEQSGINARSKLFATRSKKITLKSGITSRNSAHEDP